ncbi:MAG: response regulator transcription factor [Actinomycetota bacterium]|nr:response regulator transcription factor [Actinomycetota bacterium]
MTSAPQAGGARSTTIPGDGHRRAPGHAGPPPRPSGAARVLVVDDEPMVREVVTAYLERDGLRVTSAGDGAAALDLFDRDPPDLVILDLMLPLVDGLSVLAHVRDSARDRGTDVPVIVLTARGKEPDRVLGFDLGADDYVVKPFSPRELVGRVRSVLRRTCPPSSGPIVHGGLVIDTTAHEVTVDGEPVTLTAKEFDLLAFLAAAPRQVFRRGELLEQVWDSSADYQDPSTVTVHVRRLRNKIEADPDDPRHLVTVWGVGYRFDP